MTYYDRDPDPEYLKACSTPCQCNICAQARTDLIAALLVLLDQVDYTAGACRSNEMVGAVLDRRVIERARNAIDNAQGRKWSKTL